LIEQDQNIFVLFILFYYSFGKEHSHILSGDFF